MRGPVVSRVRTRFNDAQVRIVAILGAAVARTGTLGKAGYATRTECTGGSFDAAVNQVAPASREPKMSPEVAPK